jgi:cell division protease FtsH
MKRSAKARRTGRQELPATVPGGASAILGGVSVLRAADVDVGQARERRRQRRLARLAVVLWVATLAAWWRVLSGGSLNPLDGFSIGPDAMLWMPAVLLVVLLGAVMLVPMAGQGRSPHLLYRPEQIEVGLEDVKGLGQLQDEVVKTLNLFLGYATFRDRLGGNPRRGILFEGKPGTGKTHMAKAMARHAGVPFLFVSATSFQSMWYGMTARKIRAYFKALRRIARQEGGAIGFIEEIDAIGGRRGGLDGGGEGPVSAGTGGVVNELLVQLQSFDTPPFGERLAGRLIDWVNGWLPAHAQFAKRPPRYNNILVIAATNRGESLDPALLRPGRFDRRLYFDLPNAGGRRELIDYFLARKAHDPELDDDTRRAELAHITFGYTPVMIEHLLDESLIWALRAGRDGMSWVDINQAKLSEEIGLKQPVAYSALEKEMVATHEAGHAVAAYLSGVGRRLEVLSIVKRRDALGLLDHNDTEERWTLTRTE